MYIEEIKITNLRVFAEAGAKFQFPGRKLEAEERTLNHPNVNLILGNNGAGKSSLLKSIAIVALGPLAEKFSPYMLVRREALTADTKAKPEAGNDSAWLQSKFILNWQDESPIRAKKGFGGRMPNSVQIARSGDEEFIKCQNHPGSPTTSGRLGSEKNVRGLMGDGSWWDGIFDQKSPAFFIVGYGATRRVDTDPNAATPSQKLRSIPLRHQRVQSLFSDGYPLIWLSHWLPELRRKNPGRFKQVCNRINDVLPEDISFPAETDDSGEYLFLQHDALVPFAALSDGCRAFIGWVADMLHHLCYGCPKNTMLVDNCGIVLVDEIDLHLHPEWQRTVLPQLARTFPNIQFIVTSHSPIVVGTLQRENIWVSEAAPAGVGSVLVQKSTGVHGLSADQILLTEYFGLESSRAPEKQKRLKQIAAAAERKVPGKSDAFLKSLITAMEDEAVPTPEVPNGKHPKPAARRKRK